MKRLFAYIGFSLLITYTIVFYFGEYSNILVCLVAVGIFAVALFSKKYAKNRFAMITVALVSICACIISTIYTDCVFNPVSEKYDGKTVSLSATLIEEPSHSYNSYYYSLESKTIDGNDENIKICLRVSSELDIEIDDIINCDVALSKCDYDYNLSRGFVYEAQPENYYLDYSVTTVEDKGVLYYINSLKNKMLHAVSVIIPGDEGDLCNAVALGDKYGISRSLYSSFSKCGLTYLIVVSGLHMSIVSAFILQLLKPLSRRKFSNVIRGVIVIAFILLFMCVTGFTPSVVRSGTMMMLTLAGSVLWHRSDAMNNLGIAATVLTLNPYSVGDVGMLFSFASVAGIIVLHPRLMNYINVRLDKHDWYSRKTGRFLQYIIEMLIVSASAVIGTTPISLLFFGTCNPLVIIYSLLVTTAVSILLILTLLLIAFFYIPVLQGFAYLFGFFAYFLAKWVILVVNIGENIPFSQLTADPYYVKIWFIIVAVSFGIALLFSQRKKALRCAAAFSLVALIVGKVAIMALNYNKTTLSIYNTGRGTTAVLQSEGVCDVLACGGDAQYTDDIINQLKYCDCSMSYLLVPGSDNFSSRYSSQILSEFDVNSVLLYYKYTTNEKTYRLANECDVYKEFSDGDGLNVELAGSVTDTVLCLNYHTWQYLYNDEISVLIAPSTGNFEELPQNYRQADVLVLNSEIDNLDLMSYDCLVWASDEQLPENATNAVTTADGAVEINFE